MNIGELNAIARGMVAKNRGLLAADESSSTIKKRFDTIKLESTEENRRAYREMLFSAPGAKDYISGVILYDETLRQSTKSGVPFPTYLAQQGMIPGIKVDLGAKPLAGYPGETMTEGLDGLRERFAEYHKLGARFAKWRAVINIDAALPSRYAVNANAEGLARYAALAQEAGIVPIVEPEVLMDGGHSLERCEEVTNSVLDSVFSHLFSARVALEGMILKPNMVIPGKKCADQASPERIAEATVRTLKRQVPSAVPGIAFLSGGQSPVDATVHLNLMHALGPLPWALTFSYGRALQEDALNAWQGKQAGFAAGQKALAKRAKLNGLAAVGQYSAGLESSAA
jgi:fructose-bisphosphate aldolase class I